MFVSKQKRQQKLLKSGLLFKKIVAVSKSAAILKMESVVANCSKIKLVIYQFAFCFFVFFSGEMVSCLKEVFWCLCLLKILEKY